MTCAFLVNGTYAFVLVDSGAYRSFIASLCCKIERMEGSRIPKTFTVETISDTSVNIMRISKNSKKELEGHELPITLYFITIGGFDLV